MFQHGCVMRQPWDSRQKYNNEMTLDLPPSNVAIENKNKQNKLAKKLWWCHRPNKNKSQQTARKNHLLRSFCPWMKNMRSRQIGSFPQGIRGKNWSFTTGPSSIQIFTPSFHPIFPGIGSLQPSLPGPFSTPSTNSCASGHRNRPESKQIAKARNLEQQKTAGFPSNSAIPPSFWEIRAKSTSNNMQKAPKRPRNYNYFSKHWILSVFCCKPNSISGTYPSYVGSQTDWVFQKHSELKLPNFLTLIFSLSNVKTLEPKFSTADLSKKYPLKYLKLKELPKKDRFLRRGLFFSVYFPSAIPLKLLG